MNNDIFQKVIDSIQPYLPEGWEKIILFVGYTKGSYTMKYYVDDIDCFSLENANRMQLIKLFMHIDRILSDERKTLDEKNRWSVMTMMVSSDGTMKTEFDYADISENAIEYEEKWKEKYIGINL